jgi:alpha-ketoglutarate-dependent taurine dioxygenase
VVSAYEYGFTSRLGGVKIDGMDTWPHVLSGYEMAAVLEELHEHGAVVVRDRAGTQEDFVEFTDDLMESLPHHSVATRERDIVAAESHVATVNKGMDEIPLHRESSFLPTQPDVLAFYCQRPPAADGQTTLCDGVKLLTELSGDVRAFVESQTFTWRFRMPFERWSIALGTDSEEIASRRIGTLMTRFASLATYEYRFDDGYLDGTYRSPLILPTFWGKRPAFANSLLQYYYRKPGPLVARHLHNATISGGRDFPEDMLAAVQQCAEGLVSETNWQAGDAVIVDNSHVMHGRRSFQDNFRRILVRLGHYRPEVAAR